MLPWRSPLSPEIPDCMWAADLLGRRSPSRVAAIRMSGLTWPPRFSLASTALDAYPPRLDRGRSGSDGRAADRFGCLARSRHQDPRVGRLANMADPFGNGFNLIEFTGPGYHAVSR